MLLSFLKEKIFIVVFLITLLIGSSLAISSWHMNFWPSDAEVYYMPAAKDLFSHQYLSQIHTALDEERIKWLHGKEMHVLAIAVLQQLMQDTQSLKPLIVLGIISIFFSTLFIYLIARKLWGKTSAVALWFLFATSFWPYLYILFTKHQTQGLMFFLLSAFLLVFWKNRWVYVFSGVAMGTSIFSSTVSMLYMPLILVLFLQDKKNIVINAIIFLLGFFSIVIFVNWPDVVGNIQSYATYVGISGKMNHFFYNQKVLVQWLPSFDLKDTRGGLLWVIQYLFLVIPFISVIFLMCCVVAFKKNKLQAGYVLVLSLSGILMAEIKGVAQYGANYFPVLIGFLVLIGWSLRESVFKRWWVYIGVLSLCWNFYVYASDIYPSRMVTTRISDYIKENNIKELHTFQNNLLRPNVLDHLNPALLQRLKIMPIESVVQVNTGYILLPPVSTDTIYRASNGDYNDFDSDLMLNKIVKNGRLKDYAVTGFKTLGSSLIWAQEEEIFAYRTLMLQQFQDSDRNKAWILDAAKITKDRVLWMPTEEELALRQKNVRNVGTETRQNMYTGYQGGIAQDIVLKGIAVRLYKVGKPQDSLRAFVFKVDDKQPMWVPYSKHFISKSLESNKISNNLSNDPVVFEFDPPLNLQAGAFSVVIYRSGKPSDQNFYRIDANNLGRIE